MPWLYSVVYNGSLENHDLRFLNKIDFSPLQELESAVCFFFIMIKKIAELLIISKKILTFVFLLLVA